MKTNRWALGLISILIVCGLGIFVAMNRNPESYAPRNTQSKPSLNKSSFLVPEWVLTFGQQLEYELQYAGEIPNTNPRQHSKRFEIHGNIWLTVLEEVGDEYRILLGFVTKRTQGFEQLPKGLKEALEGALSQVVPVSLKKRGFAMRINSEAKLDPMTINFWQGLLERIQVNLPAEFEQPIYVVSESYSNGQLEAHYEFKSIERGGDLDKDKIELKKSFHNVTPSDRTIDGTSIIVLGPAMRGVHSLLFSSEESYRNANLKSRNSLKLTFLGESRLDKDAVSALQAKALSTAATSSRATKHIIQANVLGNKSFADIWALFSSMPQKQEHYLLLKAWLYQYPGEIKQLEEPLKGLSSEDDKLKVTIKALVAVGHAEAQSLLVSLLKDHASDINLSKRLVSSMGFLKNPHPMSEAAISSLMKNSTHKEIRTRAELALGIMSKTLGKSPDADDRARGSAIEKTLFHNLENAETQGQILTSLGAIGNMGPETRRSLDTYLKNSNPEIRGEAYFALRNSGEPDVTPFLVQSHAMETSSGVRKDILRAFDARDADRFWFEGIQTLLEDKNISDEDLLFLAKSLIKHAKSDIKKSQDILSKLPSYAKAENTRTILNQFEAQAQKGFSF